MTNKNNDDATCLVCYDDREAAGDTLIDLGCDHVVCRACLVFYLTQCENDRVTTATCPAQGCGRALAENLIEGVLGRPYTPKVWCKAGDNNNDGTTYNDAALEQWLEDNEALKCPNCHAWIIKEEGCSAVQCLCGMRQCWNCRAPVKNKTKDKDYSDDEEEDDFDDVEYDEDGNPSRCTCGHLADEFYDNILEEEGRPQPKLATLDELRDMAALYERRKDEDCSDYEEDDDEDDDESVVYAMDQVEEDSDDESEEGIDKEEALEETCEPADPGVFVGTFLDWEEPEEAAVAVVPLFFFSEEEEEGDDENDEDSEEEDPEPAEDENKEEAAEPATESGSVEPNPAATAENTACDEPLVAVEAPQQPSKERLPQRRCQSAPAAVLVANAPGDKDEPNQENAATSSTGEGTEKERPPRAATLWDFICSKIKKNQKQ